MKIGVYAYWNVSWNNHDLRALGCHARYLRQLLEMTEGVRLFSPVVPKTSPANSDLVVHPGLEVVPLPGGSFAGVWRKQRQLRRVLRENLDGLDAIYVRLFDPCAWLLAPLCHQRRIGLVFDIVGDPVQGILQRRDWSPAARWTRRWLFAIEEWLVFRAVQRHTLLVTGSELTRIYGPRHPSPQTIIPSTLLDEEFYAREDTCSADEVTILYTGMVRPAKRLETLVDALGCLLAQGRRVRLRIVGGGDPPSYLRRLQQYVEQAGLRAAVDFVGHLALGDAMIAEYRAADIYGFPSVTEGAARTLLEAAAHSLPMVISDVGGARDLFADGHSALLVPPDDTPAMTAALARMIDDSALRRRCIREALAVARKHTCRRFIGLLVDHLRQAADRAHPARAVA